jgi:tetratricopeptide (TPR) repeat protein
MGKICIATLLAVVLLTSSIVMGCDVAGQRLAEGDELYEQGRIEEAIDKYTEAIRPPYECEEPYHHRGIAYCDLGQIERGIQDFNEAIRICPECGDAYYSRGVAYAELGKKTEAIADFEKFLSLTDILHPEWIPMARQKIEELSE